jgi:hypothetical protein
VRAPSRAGALAVAAAVALAAGGIELALAAFGSSSSNPGNAASASPDWTAPQASAAVGAKSSGGAIAGYVRQGGSYHLSANVADTGNPPSGVATVRADASALTSGATQAALTSGNHTAGGASYGYRTSALTANATLAEGTYSFSLTVADSAGNSRTQGGYSLVVDNTAPSATDVQAVNATGGTTGKAEAGDRIVLTSSERIDPHSVLAGWSGASTNVVVRIANGSLLASDVLTVRDASNATQLPLGSVDLGSPDFLSSTRDFGATGTPSTMTQADGQITIVLGTPSGTTGTVFTARTMQWTPTATPFDRAGNAHTTAARNETGASDVDF